MTLEDGYVNLDNFVSEYEYLEESPEVYDDVKINLENDNDEI